jgi:hypothetical protein
MTTELRCGDRLLSATGITCTVARRRLRPDGDVEYRLSSQVQCGPEIITVVGHQWWTADALRSAGVTWPTGLVEAPQIVGEN